MANVLTHSLFQSLAGGKVERQPQYLCEELVLSHMND